MQIFFCLLKLSVYFEPCTLFMMYLLVVFFAVVICCFGYHRDCGVDQGGRHVDYVTDQIINKLLEVVKRKEKKAGVTIKPFQVNLYVILCMLHWP